MNKEDKLFDKNDFCMFTQETFTKEVKEIVRDVLIEEAVNGLINPRFIGMPDSVAKIIEKDKLETPLSKNLKMMGGNHEEATTEECSEVLEEKSYNCYREYQRGYQEGYGDGTSRSKMEDFIKRGLI